MAIESQPVLTAYSPVNQSPGQLPLRPGIAQQLQNQLFAQASSEFDFVSPATQQRFEQMQLLFPTVAAKSNAGVLQHVSDPAYQKLVELLNAPEMELPLHDLSPKELYMLGEAIAQGFNYGNTELSYTYGVGVAHWPDIADVFDLSHINTISSAFQSVRRAVQDIPRNDSEQMAILAVTGLLPGLIVAPGDRSELKQISEAGLEYLLGILGTEVPNISKTKIQTMLENLNGRQLRIIAELGGHRFHQGDTSRQMGYEHNYQTSLKGTNLKYEFPAIAQRMGIEYQQMIKKEQTNTKAYNAVAAVLQDQPVTLVEHTVLRKIRLLSPELLSPTGNASELKKISEAGLAELQKQVQIPGWKERLQKLNGAQIRLLLEAKAVYFEAAPLKQRLGIETLVTLGKHLKSLADGLGLNTRQVTKYRANEVAQLLQRIHGEVYLIPQLLIDFNYPKHWVVENGEIAVNTKLMKWPLHLLLEKTEFSEAQIINMINAALGLKNNERGLLGVLKWLDHVDPAGGLPLTLNDLGILRQIIINKESAHHDLNHMAAKNYGIAEHREFPGDFYAEYIAIKFAQLVNDGVLNTDIKNVPLTDSSQADAVQALRRAIFKDYPDLMQWRKRYASIYEEYPGTLANETQLWKIMTEYYFSDSGHMSFGEYYTQYPEMKAQSYLSAIKNGGHYVYLNTAEREQLNKMLFDQHDPQSIVRIIRGLIGNNAQVAEESYKLAEADINASSISPALLKPVISLYFDRAIQWGDLGLEVPSLMIKRLHDFRDSRVTLHATAAARMNPSNPAEFAERAIRVVALQLLLAQHDYVLKPDLEDGDETYSTSSISIESIIKQMGPDGENLDLRKEYPKYLELAHEVFMPDAAEAAGDTAVAESASGGDQSSGPTTDSLNMDSQSSSGLTSQHKAEDQQLFSTKDNAKAAGDYNRRVSEINPPEKKPGMIGVVPNISGAVKGSKPFTESPQETGVPSQPIEYSPPVIKPPSIDITQTDPAKSKPDDYNTLPDHIQSVLPESVYQASGLNAAEVNARYETYNQLHPEVRGEFSVFVKLHSNTIDLLKTHSAQAGVQDAELNLHNKKAQITRQLQKQLTQLQTTPTAIEMLEPKTQPASMERITMQSNIPPAHIIRNNLDSTQNNIVGANLSGRQHTVGTVNPNAAEIPMVSLKGKRGPLANSFTESDQIPKYWLRPAENGVQLQAVIEKPGDELAFMAIPNIKIPAEAKATQFNIHTQRWDGLPQLSQQQLNDAQAYLQAVQRSVIIPAAPTTGVPVNGAPINVPISIPPQVLP